MKTLVPSLYLLYFFHCFCESNNFQYCGLCVGNNCSTFSSLCVIGYQGLPFFGMNYDCYNHFFSRVISPCISPLSGKRKIPTSIIVSLISFPGNTLSNLVSISLLI